MKPTSSSSLHPLHAMLCTVLLAAPFGAAWAAPDREAIQAQYQADRKLCMALQGDSPARETCLKEAGAARQAALRGTLAGSASPEVLRRNALARCEVHKDAIDRASCERMTLGEGASQGSVEGGGVFKEMVVPVDPS